MTHGEREDHQAEPSSDVAEEFSTDGPLSTDFSHLFTVYHQGIYNFFANQGFSKEESRDLTQETFLQAFQGRQGFRGEAQPKSWLRSVAANTLKRVLRDRNRDKRKARELSLDQLDEHRRLRLVEAPNTSEPSPPLHEALSEENKRLVRQALEELPEQVRLCMKLSLDRGLKVREIAVTLKISEGTVKSYMSEGRVKLKAHLAHHFSDSSKRRSS